MIAHVFEVAVHVRDDDQTDPEAIVDILAASLRKLYNDNIEEFGVAWPEGWTVRHITRNDKENPNA